MSNYSRTLPVFVVLVLVVGRYALGAEPTAGRNVLRYAQSDYGRALDARQGGVVFDSTNKLGQLPLTIEARVRIMRRNFFFYYVIVSAGSREDSVAWQLSLQERKGLVLSIDQWSSSHPFDLPDDKWHDLAIHVDETEVRFHVDGDLIGTGKPPAPLKLLEAHKLWVGQSADGVRTCEGLIDDLRISAGLKPVRNAWSRDDDTIAFLDFEETTSEYLAQWTPIPSTRVGTEDWELESDADWMDERFQQMEKGPFFANSTELPDRRIGPKNLSIDLGHGAQVMFDSQRCVTVAGLTRARLNIQPQRFGILRRPIMEGTEQFYVDAARAWQRYDSATDALMSVDDGEIRYGGLYLHDDGVVLEYRVTGARLLELNSVRAVDQVGHVFRRDFYFQSMPDGPKLSLGIAELGDGEWSAKRNEILVQDGDQISAVHVASSGGKAQLFRQGNRAVVSMPSSDSNLSLVLWNGAASDLSRFRQHCLTREPKDLSQLTHGSSRRWGEPIRVPCKVVSSGDVPYVVDDIGMPLDNPYRALMFATGFDFFSSGSVAALCTVHGDVWLVSGITDELDEVHWQRFATGLYQPLGLKVVDDIPYVLGRDQITKLHDLNRDGEADYYENFNNDLIISGQNHAYAMCLETDPQGNFYFLKSGSMPPHGSSLLKLSRDGSRLDVFATGYRHANGLGVGPDGTVTAADNQGNWIPTSSIQVVEEGSFHGYEPERHRPDRPDRFDQPLCWIPHFIDNSSGGQVWCDHDRWGPFQGQLLHLSWGRCSLHLVMRQPVDSQWQGGTVQFPNITFASGPARARFNSRDGHLYVCGLDGWQTGAKRDGCFQRVRYTGTPVMMPRTVDAHRNGLRVTFTQPIDQATATDPSNFEVTQWQYRWTKEYGSSEFSIADPTRIGHDSVEVAKVSVGPNEVFLHIPSIQPVMQMSVASRVKSRTGVEHTFNIYNTIHVLAEEFTPSR